MLATWTHSIRYIDRNSEQEEPPSLQIVDSFPELIPLESHIVNPGVIVFQSGDGCQSLFFVKKPGVNGGVGQGEEEE